MPDAGGLGEFINTYGLNIGIVIWSVIGLAKLITDHGPAVVRRYQDRREDDAEHKQKLEDRRARHVELLALTEAGNRTYTEEQLTHHLSEVYVEFAAVNSFIRETLFSQTQRIESKIDQLLIDARHIEPMAEKLAEIRMYVKAMHVNNGEVKDPDEVLSLLEKILESGKIESENAKDQSEISDK